MTTPQISPELRTLSEILDGLTPEQTRKALAFLHGYDKRTFAMVIEYVTGGAA
ncbi:hypothetical protein [Nonomuraea lactucae]|uniref:hypothetical protein n=1 Tax=Nonomuraea lactucae TaxID=2249762 RepID=UPI0013B4293E|nr:hypothetical protein [Nonomuraea lactucae]